MNKCTYCNGSGVEPTIKPNYVRRRRLLKHVQGCLMSYNISLPCTCHYDECLNWKKKGWEHSSRCICKDINAKAKHDLYLAEKRSKPWFIRIFIRKKFYFDFYE